MRLNLPVVSTAFLALALSVDAATKKFEFAPTEAQRREAAARPAEKSQTEKTADAVNAAGDAANVSNNPLKALGGEWRRARNAARELKAVAILAPGTRLLLEEEIAKNVKAGPVAVIFGAPKDTGPAEASLTSTNFSFNGTLAYAVVNDVDGPYKDDWKDLHEANATKNAKGKVTSENKVAFFIGDATKPAFAVDYAALSTPEGAKAVAERLQVAVAAYKPVAPNAETGVTGAVTNATGKLNEATGTATRTQDAVNKATTPPTVPTAPTISNPLAPK